MTDVHPLLLALERRDRLSADDRRAVEALPLRERRFAKGDVIVEQGSRPTESFLMLAGFTARLHRFADGASQILSVHLAGDFVDLHALVLKRMDHAVAALSDGRGVFVSHAALVGVTERSAHLTRLLWMLAEVDSAIQRNWLAYLGRRSALQRMANLFCAVFARLQVVGEATGRSFPFPVSQAELADMLGVSVVHANRTLKDLRTAGLLQWRGQTVTIHDWSRLQALGEFDPTCLSLQNEPR